MTLKGHFSLWLFLALAPACTQDSKAKKQVFGEIEADEVDVASRIAGRVKKIRVARGQKVKAGEPLVEFEDDIMSVKRQGAVATIAAAESKRDIANDAVRPEEKLQLQAAVSAAKKQMDFAKTTFDRMQSLVQEGAIPQQTLDEIEFKYQQAKENYNATLAKQKMANVGARDEEKAAAGALVDQARSVLAEVEAYEKDMILTSPIDGEVAMIVAKEGELVPTGYPVVTVVKTHEPWVVFSVSEDQLKLFALNQPVSVEIPALGKDQHKGNVSYIAALANFATKTFTQDKGSYDLKTFEVNVRLSAPLDNLRPGMTALVRAEK